MKCKFVITQTLFFQFIYLHDNFHKLITNCFFNFFFQVRFNISTKLKHVQFIVQNSF